VSERGNVISKFFVGLAAAAGGVHNCLYNVYVSEARHMGATHLG
jgi:hypothetical protein